MVEVSKKQEQNLLKKMKDNEVMSVLTIIISCFSNFAMPSKKRMVLKQLPFYSFVSGEV